MRTGLRHLKERATGELVIEKTSTVYCRDDMIDVLFAFLAGGTITAAVTWLETLGQPTLSALALLFPVTTWISYLFIGHLSGPSAVVHNIRFVVIGTILVWIPYMFTIYHFAPRIGTPKAVALAIIVFLVLALLFTFVYGKVAA